MTARNPSPESLPARLRRDADALVAEPAKNLPAAVLAQLPSRASASASPVSYRRRLSLLSAAAAALALALAWPSGPQRLDTVARPRSAGDLTSVWVAVPAPARPSAPAQTRAGNPPRLDWLLPVPPSDPLATVDRVLRSDIVGAARQTEALLRSLVSHAARPLLEMGSAVRASSSH